MYRNLSTPLFPLSFRKLLLEINEARLKLVHLSPSLNATCPENNLNREDPMEQISDDGLHCLTTVPALLVIQAKVFIFQI